MILQERRHHQELGVGGGRGGRAILSSLLEERVFGAGGVTAEMRDAFPLQGWLRRVF